MQFSGNFKGKPPILSYFWAQGPLGSKLLWGPLTKILDPPLHHLQCCKRLQAGLYGIPSGYSILDLIENPDKLSCQLAEQEPLWEPGTQEFSDALNLNVFATAPQGVTHHWQNKGWRFREGGLAFQ